MSKKKLLSNWRDHHASLNDQEKEEIRTKIMAACEWSYSTFFRKMNAPGKLRYWEKVVVYEAYGKKINILLSEPTKQALPL